MPSRITSCLTVCIALFAAAHSGHSFARGQSLPPTTTPAPAPAAAPLDIAQASGLTFRDAKIAEALQLFEAGKVKESTDSLFAVINDRAQRDQQRIKELQAAAAMLLLRSGERPDMQKSIAILANLANYNGDTDLARRAQVLRLVADKRIKDGTKDIADLRNREGWLAYLLQTKRDLENVLDEETARLEKYVENGGCSLAQALRKPDDVIEQLAVIQLETEHTRQLFNNYGQRLLIIANGFADNARAKVAKAYELIALGRVRRRDGSYGNYIHMRSINDCYADARSANKACSDILKARSELRIRHGIDTGTNSVDRCRVPANVR